MSITRIFGQKFRPVARWRAAGILGLTESRPLARIGFRLFQVNDVVSVIAGDDFLRARRVAKQADRG
jgi:hypothetical protein